MAQPIAANCRSVVYAYLTQHGVPNTGAPVIFVVETYTAFRFEVFYSWVTFPSVDANTSTFHKYCPTDTCCI